MPTGTPGCRQPSGVITQDGITYVPITGRPLQTEGVALPAIQSTATPFTRPVEAWVGSKSGAGAAEGTANEKQREEERAAANQPPGVIPEPPCGPAGEYCEGPGENGEEGGGGGGCSGTNACAVRYNPHHHGGVAEYHEEGNGYAGCSVWASYGSEDYTSGISGEIEIYGHWQCAEAVPMFEIQITLLIFHEDKWVGVPGDTAVTEHYFDVSSTEPEKPTVGDFRCGPEHADYDAWVFGRQYDGSYHARWWSWGREAEIRTSCHGGVSPP
jgi:hypothetical protein